MQRLGRLALQLFISGKESQSKIYLKHKLVHVSDSDTLKYANPELNSLYETVLEKEAGWNSAGYWCFYHAQASRLGFFQNFTKSLINELHKQGTIREKLDDDFLIIQNRFGMLVSNEAEAERVRSLANAEQESMMIDRTEDWQSPHRLSVNAFLAGNQSDPGRCTLHYLKYNRNCNIVRSGLSTHKLLKDLHIPSEIFSAYFYKLTKLEIMRENLFKQHGRLLQICIAKDKVDQFVYLSEPGGYRTSYLTLNGIKITKVSEFLELACTAPEQMQFVHLDQGSECAIPLTPAGVLNPSNGIKVLAYDSKPNDPRYYKEYVEEASALVKNIALDIATYKETEDKKYYFV